MSTASKLLQELRDVPLTQSEIAKLTGMTQPMVCKWEKKAPVSADHALEIKRLHERKVARVRSRAQREAKGAA
jgi:predicted transcriptional regulator